MSDNACPSLNRCRRALNFALLLALLGGLTVTVWLEWPRWQVLIESGQWGNLLIRFHYDSTLPQMLFLLLPICWLFRTGRDNKHRAAEEESNRQAIQEPFRPLRDLLTPLGLACLSLFMSHHVARLEVNNFRFGDLPPAYNDEYSYLLQAETYLDGRLSYPVHPTHPELFSEMHVVNDHRFASRYFPVTGLVIAPFLAIGHPDWGHWLCGALTTVFMFLAGRELGGYRTGLWTGLFCALSPALALFSNLLLAHHPTLMGLSAFLYFYLRMWRTRSIGSGVFAGVGLTFAMLARPMAAAGFALPMGVVLLANLIRPVRWGDDEVPPSRKRVFGLNLAVGTPVLVGLLILLPINKSITGDSLKLPYSQFEEVYTPKHTYGFHNVERGAGKRQKQTFANYDNWAENLTLETAVAKLGKRLVASLRWTWGIVPLTMAGLFGLVLAVVARNRWTMIAASLFTIYLVHLPYWYTGIQDWHYVFESSLIWLLLLGGTTSCLFEVFSTSGRPLMRIWWLGMVTAPLLTMYFSADGFWEIARMQNEIEEIAYSRMNYQRFNDLLEEAIGDEPALVLIHHDPADLHHIDYVINRPPWDAPILRGRADEGKPDQERLAELRKSFPGRELWYCDVVKKRDDLTGLDVVTWRLEKL